MSNRHFHLRLQASYQGDENKVDELSVEMLNENQWETLDLDIHSPGFVMFINALFSCQHLYMRANCAERDLLLESATGELQIEASEIWAMLNISVRFDGKLRAGEPSDEALAYITQRMHHCPVSTNLPKHIPMQVSVTLD